MEQDEIGKMLPIFGDGIPDRYLELKRSRGQKQAKKEVSRWQLAVKEAGDFLGRKDYKLLAIKLSHYSSKPEWILDIIKQAKTGNNPKALFWWLVKQK